MAKKTRSEEIHAITLEEHASMLAQLEADAEVVLAQRVAWFNSHRKGVISAPISDIEKAIEEQERVVLNGHAAALLPAQLNGDDEKPLIIRHEALKRAIDKLRKDKRLAVLLTEQAVGWYEDHADPSLDIECVLAWVRVWALEQRRSARWQAARKFADYLPQNPVSALWAETLADGLYWDRNPLAKALNAFLAAGVITEAQIRKAMEI